MAGRRHRRGTLPSNESAEARAKRNEQRKQVAAFAKDRDAALLSLDRETFLAFVLKWQAWTGVNPDMLASEALTEVLMHKMRTATKSLPLAERRKSKEWLAMHQLRSNDEGEL